MLDANKKEKKKPTKSFKKNKKIMQLEQTSEEIRKGKQSYSHLASSHQEHTVVNT